MHGTQLGVKLWSHSHKNTLHCHLNFGANKCLAEDGQKNPLEVEVRITDIAHTKMDMTMVMIVMRAMTNSGTITSKCLCVCVQLRSNLQF